VPERSTHTKDQRGDARGATRPECLGQPPSYLHDPFVRRLYLPRAQWGRAIRGCIRERGDVAVAKTVADYANKDGSNAHPGIARLADDLCCSTRTIKRSLGWLSEYGFLSVAERGRRKLGEADVYCLSLPAPVADKLGLWRENFGEHWMERPEYVPKREFLGDAAGPYNPVLGDTA
jgi:hypothetical protein